MRPSASSTSWPVDAPRGAPGRRAATALLFDEQLNPRIADALRALAAPAGLPGGDAPAPPRGADDAAVVAHCLRTGRVLVSSSYDMVIMCAEEGQRIVWLDPWTREFTRNEQVAVLFSQLQEIERLLDEGAECIRVLRTRVEALAVEEAARLARQRLRGLAIARSKSA